MICIAFLTMARPRGAVVLGRIIELDEHVEYLLLLVPGDADALVLDPEAHLRAALLVPDANVWRGSLVLELDRIAEEVGDDLVEGGFAPTHLGKRPSMRTSAAGGLKLALGRDDIPHYLVEIERLLRRFVAEMWV